MINAYIYICFYFLCIFLKKYRLEIQQLILIVTCVILTFLIGFRDGWPDQIAYQMAFDLVPYPWDFTWDTEPFAYVEKGYFFLASLVKAIYDGPVFYCIAMGAISMYLLYKILDKYSIFPLLGLCVYIARFLLSRDFTQMRSSLAILLIMLGTKYIYEKKPIKYFLLVFLAYQFHMMALIAVPMYFFYRLNLTNKKIIIGLILSLAFSQTLAGFISGTVDNYSQDLNYETYTEGGYVDKALGLRNLMIYFQMGVLLLFTFGEDKLKHLSKYYYVFRSGYFYSTLILIFFCNYTALSGRTSTMFATYEMFILPMLAYSFSKGFRPVYYLGLGVVLLYFFYSKYMAAITMMAGGVL